MRRLIGAFKLAAGIAWTIPAVDMLVAIGGPDSAKGFVVFAITLVAALLALGGLLELVTGSSVGELHERFARLSVPMRKLIGALVVLIVSGVLFLAFLLHLRSVGS